MVQANYILQMIIDNIGLPILIALGGGLAIIAGKWVDKVADSIRVRNEISSIKTQVEIRKDLLETLEPAVKSAVASNMKLSKAMKKKGKLSDKDIEELRTTARDMVMTTLPESLTMDGGELLKIMGGRDQLSSAIDVMIERYVYEYKLQEKENANKPNPVPNNKHKSFYDLLK